MVSPSPHERHDMYNTPATSAAVTRSERRTTSRLLGLGPLVLLAPHLLFGFSAAVPLAQNNVQRRSMFPLDRRGSDESSTHPQIWVPILAISIVVMVLSIVRCRNKEILKRFSPWRWMSTTRSSARPAQGVRELTAEQLAGGTSGTSAPAGTTANANANRTRRTRRPRRTPSQISTVSLPAYNKEPGEEELVIFRGPQDMEDAGLHPDVVAVVMPPVSEDGEESIHSNDTTEAERYPLAPMSPNDMPLLQSDDGDSNTDNRTQARLPEDAAARQSLETLDSSEEGNSLMRANASTPAYEDTRGEAPAYFEAVDLAGDTRQALPTEGAPSLSPSPSRSSPEPLPPRRSGFRTLLGSLPNRMSMSHGASQPSHTRASSGFSVVSSHGREASHSRASHRPTPSGSGSILSLSPFRTLSRQKSTTTLNLNSPSLISLNSISAPLTHTVVRTEFTYPKAGPTPEQLKLISSRESFARFGVPYGADAIAYAASASRQDLDVPPPDFDVRQSDTQHIPGSVGPSRLRTASNAADLQHISNDSAVSSEDDAIPSITNNDVTLATEDPTPSLTTSPPSPGLEVLTLEAQSDLAPPTAFRAPSIFERSESRASSMQSYATAAESVMPPPKESHNDSEPTTPKMGGKHSLEPTDATVTQDATASANTN